MGKLAAALGWPSPPEVEEREPAPPSKLPAPDAWSYQSETLPLAPTGDDRLPPGVGYVIARQLCETIKVVNLGTVDLVVQSGAPKNAPDLIGPGVALVPPGGFEVLTMPEHIHSFYGRPGECVGVTRYQRAQPATAGRISDGLWHSVDLGTVAASGVGYATPWGTRAVLGGFGARETGDASPVTFRLRDGDANGGVLLEPVTISPRGSTSDSAMWVACVTSAIYVEYIGGGGVLEMVLRVH